jgi:hydroxymethylbilane synthase
MRRIRIGTRGSRLALLQAHAVRTTLEEVLPGRPIEVEVIETEGDRVQDRPLDAMGGSGVFVKEIESALLEGRIDVAVHSMKDLTSTLPEGLAIAATTERGDPRDVLVSRAATSVASLPEGATVATGSLRRRSELLSLRPDLHVVDLRGNVPTRLEKFDRSSWEAIVLAGAGLLRLGLERRIRAYIPVDAMIPAVGQGALAVEIREDDAELRRELLVLNHPETARAVAAERAFLARLEGGCRTPIGGHGETRDGELVLRGYVGSVDGRRSLRRELRGSVDAPEELGVELAASMLDDGAAEIIGEIGKPP